ncbi:hypothetical protein SMU56_03274 [Streptococcus mutans N29]|uniref:DUF4062 domain-containing protein n=1 Tax=Streptococcus mutans TaxID=1309 RepID=UPI0002B55C05|nr:DUF4062 domain-containing protein [Streptococcus mutans]EMB87995.1 hypothetical protein SMU56_03274 [Streptococcus mutans N29]
MSKVVEKVKEPLLVFISSKCDDKYEEVRHKIFEIMNKSPLVTPYIYEYEGASSIPSRQNYTFELQRSDLFVCIIDNADGISKSVKDEIDKARRMNKNCLFFFCSEKSNKITQLQKDLDGSSNPKYAVVEKFDDIPDKVIDSINKDVVSRYRYKNFHISEGSSLDSISEVITTGPTYSVKTFLNTNIISNYIMRSIDIRLENDTKYSDLEKNLLSFFRVMIKLEKIDFDIFDNLTKEVIKKQDEHLRKVIQMRFEALKFYLKGDFDNAICLLSETLKKAADDVQVPSWIANNIAIDLRNVISESNNLKNYWRRENEGQEFIDNRKEDLYFPLLDRKEESLQEQLNKIYFDSQNGNTLFNLQNMGIFKYLEEIFVVAFTYGSITHLFISIKDLTNTLNILNMVYSDYEIQKELIRLWIVNNDKKELEKYSVYRSEMQLFISNEDVNQVIDSINNIYIPYNRYNSKLLLMIEFSDYLSDEIFDIETTDLIGYIVQWLRKENPILSLENNIFEFLRKIVPRVNNKKLIPIIDIVFRNKLRRFYDDIFKLMRQIDYKEFDETTQNRILGYFISSINEENPYGEFGNAVITFTKQSTIDVTEIERLLKSRFENFYKERYLLEHTHKENGEEFIITLLEKIDHDNSTQGVNGEYSYGSDDYGTIINIVKYDELILSQYVLKETIKTCINTLIIDRQKIEEKIQAIQLLVQLYSNHKNSINWNTDVVNKIRLINIDEITGHYNNVLFNTGNTKKVLKLAISLLLSIFDKSYSQLFVNQLLTVKLDAEAESRRALEVINHFLECCNSEEIAKEVLNSVAYFSAYMLNSKLVQYQKVAVFSLICLSKFNCVKELALNQISVFWNVAVSELKLVIIYNIDKVYSDDEFKQYLLEKAKLDNHYRVKQIAEEKIQVFQTI